MNIVEAVEKSIEKAIEDGTIDQERHAAPIQALRNLAVRAEGASERDNVTYPTMLKYMTALGMMPHEITVTRQADEKPPTTMERMRGKFKNRA